jgi:hypothetical protein
MSKAQRRTKETGQYYEKHHIVPRALGGKTLPENLVYLTPKEHYIGHHLLTKFTEGRSKRKMLHAWLLMAKCDGTGKRYVPAIQYDFLRIELNKNGRSGVSIDDIIEDYNKGFSTVSIANKYKLNKSSIRRRLLRAGVKLRSAKETRSTGINPPPRPRGTILFSEETKQKMSKSQKNRFENTPHPFLGKKHTEEGLTKISVSRKGKANFKNSIIQKKLIAEQGTERLSKIGKLGAAARWRQ